MTPLRVTLSLASLALLVSLSAQAQGLKLAPQSSTAPKQSSAQSADFIVAVVNSEPITNNEVRRELEKAWQLASQQGRPQAASEALAKQVLDSLIDQKVQLHQARSAAKKAIRAMVRVDQEGKTVALVLPRLCNMMCNFFFTLCLVINKRRNISETVFISKSYGR